MPTPTSFHADFAQRRFDLDRVRSGAFRLLIACHVGMYYVTRDWHVNSPYAADDRGTPLDYEPGDESVVAVREFLFDETLQAT